MFRRISRLSNSNHSSHLEDEGLERVRDNKSEVLIIGPDSLTHSTQNFSLNIDGSTKIRNLGVILDPTISFLPHVNHITKTAFFRNIAYCNSLLYGTTTKVLNKLQYVQDSARLLTGTRSREHITPVLRELHWLPIKHRINFKIALTTKALNNLAPPPTLPTSSITTPPPDPSGPSLPTFCKSPGLSAGLGECYRAVRTLEGLLAELLTVTPHLHNRGTPGPLQCYMRCCPTVLLSLTLAMQDQPHTCNDLSPPSDVLSCQGQRRTKHDHIR
ncbi:hypothetical protein N1851_034075 [Merluccius polli]|uniref:Uncharacterized protein n=1 Tax=Merluccius polli TaxID=89951 RepID=A0AA47M0G7_MERPO|nr:hypothetical protein N1851_034075 [Merluccius polli]